MDAAVAHVRSARPEDPQAPVLMPGEPERQMMQQRTAQGIPIDDESWHELVAAAVSVGMSAERVEELARS